MAKKDHPTPDQGRVKLRVIEFEVDGSNATLTEGMRNIAAALQRGNGASQMRAIQTANDSAPSPLVTELTEDIEHEDVDGSDAKPATTSRRGTGRGRPPSLKPVEGIDWTSEPALADFVNDLDLEGNNMRKYTAIAYWFKEHRATPVITLNHIYSAYKHLGWGADLPKFAGDPMKDLKNKRDYQWFDSPARGQFAINSYGGQQIMKWRKGAS